MGFDGDEEIPVELPRWLAKAQAKNQGFSATDAQGKHIPLSALGNYIDDRGAFEVKGFYFVRVRGDVEFFKNNARKAGYDI
jgi:hypothetical protein